MHRVSFLAAVAAIATAGLVAYGATGFGTAAQDAPL